MSKEIRPRLTDEWFELIDLVKDIGVEEALHRMDTFHAGKVVFDSKANTIDIDTTRILTMEDLLKVAEVDLEEWIVRDKLLNKWEVGAKGPDGNIVVKPLFQVKLWLKRRGFEAPDSHWTQKWLDRLAVDTKSKYKNRCVTGDVANIVLADIHLGRYSDGNLGAYNVDVIRERLDTIANIANANGKRIKVFMLGDMIESFTGKNKPNTWKQIEMYGAQVALHAYDVLEEFFSKLENFDECLFVGGNHDRITDAKDDDNGGQVLEIINGVFERKGKYKTSFDPTLQTLDVDKVRYILTHGDKKISKMNPAEMILRHGRQDAFNCMLSAHYHQKMLVSEGENYTQRVVPPIASGSEYEYVSGWHANPGFLIVSEFNGKVKFEEYPV
jgi:UDP-2,3-diacylglucosamine pyrophosphatase LpxH